MEETTAATTTEGSSRKKLDSYFYLGLKKQVPIELSRFLAKIELMVIFLKRRRILTKK